MIEFTLKEQIYAFVKSVRIVKRNQIYRFFRDFKPTDVAFWIKRLIAENYLHEHEEDRISTAKTLYAPMTSYDGTIDALEAVCEFTSREILWISTQDYPMNIAFGTVLGEAYCVSTFTQNWQVKYSITPHAREIHVPQGEPDIMKYIAVVRDIKILPKINPLGFSLYVVINPDGQIDLYNPPEES